MPNRRRPAHGVFWPDDQPPIVFLTVCTKDRAEWLSEDAVHRCLVEVWRDADRWRVGRYVLMPDHLHLFAAPVNGSTGLENWVSYWKSQFTKTHQNPTHRWQPGHWDTRLRREESYDEKWEYVRSNPVRAGLVTNPDAWPYQGEVFALRWGD